MKKIFAILALFLSAFGFLSAQSKENFTFVLQHSIRLYAEPETSSTEIITIEEGTAVNIYPYDKGWIKIDFSKEIEAWVAACFLKDDGTYTDKVIFRTHPTAASSSLSLRNSFVGKKAQIIDSDKDGHWKKVFLKGEFSGYISQKDFEISLRRRTSAPAVSHSQIVSTVIGRLLPLEKPVKGATHKLVYKVNDMEYLVAYVIPDKVNLRLWENWMIYLSGESIWNPSIYTPFLKGVNIFPAYR